MSDRSGYTVVARRYAQAVVEVASAEDAVDRVGADLDRVVALAAANDDQLAAILESPVFTVEERRGVLDQILPKLKLHQITMNLLHLVNDKRRMALLAAIADAYRTFADQLAGRERVTVETAEPLTPQLETEVRAALEALTRKTVVLRTEVRPELIGGLVARVGGKVYDSSLRTRLVQLKQTLLRSPIAQA